MDAIKRILYITYDGLTDPLGQSQILPYLKALAKYGYQFTILSFEKAERFQKEGDLVRSITREAGINWVPLSFTAKPPLLSKFYDAVRMRNKAVSLHRRDNFHMVHCRSYIAADVGLYLKKNFGVRFFFDMRGFWADEKKDGSWNVANPVFKQVYRYYKNKEAQYLQQADYIISLTHAGKKEMMTWPAYKKQVPLSVIPCCTDMEHFSLTDDQQKWQAREKLGISNEKLVISYLGSVGTWYMLDEMLQLFARIKEQFPDALFLFVTHSHPDLILSRLSTFAISAEDVLITQASRKEVPLLIKASDVNISFIKPVYSKISSSPTKLGEVLSMGIPVICNSGVGDVEKIVRDADAGYIVHGFAERDLTSAVEAIPALLKKSPQRIRNAIETIYSLEKGVDAYRSCYRKALS